MSPCVPRAVLVLVVLPSLVAHLDQCAGENLLAVAGIEIIQSERSGRHSLGAIAGQRLVVARVIGVSRDPDGLSFLGVRERVAVAGGP